MKVNKPHTKESHKPVQCYWPWGGNKPSPEGSVLTEEDLETTSENPKTWGSYFSNWGTYVSDKANVASDAFWGVTNMAYNASTKMLTDYMLQMLSKYGIQIKDSEIPKLLKYATYFILGGLETNSEKDKLDLEVKNIKIKKDGKIVELKDTTLKGFRLLTFNFSTKTSQAQIESFDTQVDVKSDVTTTDTNKVQFSGDLKIRDFNLELQQVNTANIIANAVLHGIDQVCQTDKMDKENPDKSFKEALIEKLKAGTKNDLKTNLELQAGLIEMNINYLLSPSLILLPEKTKSENTINYNSQGEEELILDDARTANFKIEDTNFAISSNGLNKLNLDTKSIDVSFDNLSLAKEDDDNYLLDYISYLNNFQLKLDENGNGYLKTRISLKPRTLKKIIQQNSDSITQILNNKNEAIINTLGTDNFSSLIAPLKKAKKNKFINLSVPITDNVLNFSKVDINLENHKKISPILQKIMRERVKVVNRKKASIFGKTKDINPEIRIPTLGKKATKITLESLGIPLGKHHERHALIPKDPLKKKDSGGINFKHFTEITLENTVLEELFSNVEKPDNGFDIIDTPSSTPITEADMEEIPTVDGNIEDNFNTIANPTPRSATPKFLSAENLGFEVTPESNDVANIIASTVAPSSVTVEEHLGYDFITHKDLNLNTTTDYDSGYDSDRNSPIDTTLSSTIDSSFDVIEANDIANMTTNSSNLQPIPSYTPPKKKGFFERAKAKAFSPKIGRRFRGLLGS